MPEGFDPPGRARGRAIEAACDEYDTKPVEFSRLLRKMEALLARTRTTETTSPLTRDATVWSA